MLKWTSLGSSGCGSKWRISTVLPTARGKKCWGDFEAGLAIRSHPHKKPYKVMEVIRDSQKKNRRISSSKVYKTWASSCPLGSHWALLSPRHQSFGTRRCRVAVPNGCTWMCGMVQVGYLWGDRGVVDPLLKASLRCILKKHQGTFPDIIQDFYCTRQTGCNVSYHQ